MRAAEPSPTPGEPSAAGHLEHLDGLRGAAALYVLFHHVWLEAGLKYYLFGHFAVALFITLSGFSLMLPVLRADGKLTGGAVSFFKRRARRILPPYYAAVLLSLGLAWIAHLGRAPGSPSLIPPAEEIVAHLLLAQDTHPSFNQSMNRALWTIAVEWRIYLFFPVLVWLRSRYGAGLTTAAVLIFSAALLQLLKATPVNTAIHGVSPQFLGLFALGMLAAEISLATSGPLHGLAERVPSVPFTGALTLMTAFLAQVQPWSVPLIHYIDYAVGLWCAALLITAYRVGWLRRALAWRPLAEVGLFSYSLYLIHMPMIRVFRIYVADPLRLPAPGPFLLMLLAGAPLIVLGARRFFRTFELPFLRRPDLRATGKSGGSRE